MIIAGLLVMALLLTAAALIMRPAVAANPRESWSPRVLELLDHVRDPVRRLAHRNGHDGHDKVHKAVAAPVTSGQDQYLDGFDLRSVAQFGIRFFGSLAAAACVGFAIVWALASVVGVVGDLERFMRDIGFAGFKFLSIEVILGVVLLAAASVAVAVTVTVMGAALYNVLARRRDGIRIFISQERTSQVKSGDATVKPPSRETARRVS